MRYLFDTLFFFNSCSTCKSCVPPQQCVKCSFNVRCQTVSFNVRYWFGVVGVKHPCLYFSQGSWWLVRCAVSRGSKFRPRRCWGWVSGARGGGSQRCCRLAAGVCWLLVWWGGDGRWCKSVPPIPAAAHAPENSTSFHFCLLSCPRAHSDTQDSPAGFHLLIWIPDTVNLPCVGTGAITCSNSQ